MVWRALVNFLSPVMIWCISLFMISPNHAKIKSLNGRIIFYPKNCDTIGVIILLMRISSSSLKALPFNALLAILLIVVMAGAHVAHAQQSRNRLPLVRDAEIEGLLQDYTRPIFKAAGLRSQSIEIFLVNRPEFNAFVTGRRMFINLGAIQTAETPNEIIGVIAHETGHIIGGHLHRLRQRVESAQAMAVLGMLAGIGSAVVGGEAGEAAGNALIFNAQNSLRRNVLSYRREEEQAADRTAFELLQKTHQSAKGLLTTFERFSRGLGLNANPNPYVRSHPLPRQRIALMKTLATSSPYFGKRDSNSLQFRHDMARAKIAAYSQNPGTLQRLFRGNLNSPAALYGDAIATFLEGSASKALPKIDSLIKRYPKNPYLYEMKGEILISSGKPAKAIAPLRMAMKLDRYKSGMIEIQLGHAIASSGNRKLLDKAIHHLKAGISRDPRTSDGFRYLARAYQLKGKPVLAIAAAAEHNFTIGKFKQAKQLAHRAQLKLKPGSTDWLKLQDIINYKVPKRKRKFR